MHGSCACPCSLHPSPSSEAVAFVTVSDARGTPRRRVEAIIKPFKLDTVTAALRDAGVVDLIVSNVRGFGRQAGYTELYRGHAYVLRFVPRLKVEFLVAEDRVDAVVSLICRTARSQTPGNGKILVSAVEDSPPA